ncbi:hypothetical protein [Leptolyngbya sp. O-77]|uniref:hypothetical protein n=1 Tax=Leptolyngbya sp. O-77 TaxID=1080068 RepID=UPI000AC80855|nr:hypothetical protein [Leptolyngbya sp. O-77]
MGWRFWVGDFGLAILDWRFWIGDFGWVFWIGDFGLRSLSLFQSTIQNLKSKI